MPYIFRAGSAARRFTAIFAICLLLFSLGACGGRGGPADPAGGGEPGNPNDRKLAYGVTVAVPADWSVVSSLSADAAPKAALDARRQKGEQVQLLEASGAPGARGLQPSISLFLVNQADAFIPRNFAEKLNEEEFAAMARKIVEREKTFVKKNKNHNTLLEVQFTRDSIGGNLALMQRMLVVGPDGKPVRFLGWDVYLQNGAGLTVRCAYDQESPGVESAVTNIVKSLRVR
jgi:hypothetical protein